MRTLLPLGLAAAVGLLSACPPPKCEGKDCPSSDGGFREPLCTQWSSTSFAGAVGGCKDITQRTFDLGADGCDQKLAACSDQDKAALTVLLQCYNQLSASPCLYDDEVPFQKKLFACNDTFEKAASEACRAALYSGKLNPEGLKLVRRPDVDGGGALDLIVVADEDSFALSWSATQRGGVERWSIQSDNATGERLPEVSVTPNTVTVYNEYDAGTGVKKSFFVLGLDDQDEVVRGILEGQDGGAADAGGCRGPLDCPIDRVCNLGQCQVLACQTSGVCPAGYVCETGGSRTCIRQFTGDAGVDAGTTDAGLPVAGRPFVSEKVTATTGVPKFSEERFFSGFSPRQGGDVVALDSARQVIALEQEGQLFAHMTQNRGRSFTVGQIDSLGTGVKLAYVPSTRTLFACYNAGNGVRVRRSNDFGKSWGQASEVADIMNPAPSDGGVPARIFDCDIAPWRDGRAMVVAVGEEQLGLWTVTSGLSLEGPEVAFVSSPADAGTGALDVVNPQRPAIATLPEDRVVHIGFTGQRTHQGGPDNEPYGIFRGPTTGGVFKFAGNMTYLGTSKPASALAQDHVAIAIDPRTKQPIAAFASQEADRLGGMHMAVHVSMFSAAAEKWGMRSDLSVFTTRLQSDDYYLFPDRTIGDKWNAFAPNLAVTPGGKVYLALVAGSERSPSGAADYHGYVVPFDFQGASPESAAKGWFVPPARKSGPTKIVDPRGGNLNPTWTGFAADSQISVYLVYTEGIGTNVDVPNRPVMVTLP